MTRSPPRRKASKVLSSPEEQRLEPNAVETVHVYSGNRRMLVPIATREACLQLYFLHAKIFIFKQNHFMEPLLGRGYEVFKEVTKEGDQELRQKAVKTPAIYTKSKSS